MIEFELTEEFIPLISLLKMLSIAQSGGEAKTFVDEGLVKVNGKIEYRKRLKLRNGDQVEIFDQTINII